MKAAIWHGYKDIRISDSPVPKALPGHVVIKVAWAGICGTDRHEYLGPNFIPVSTPHRLTGETAPLILGHECTGVIAELGEGVNDWRVGDRVTANGTLSCGVCEPCRNGRYNVCEKLGFVGVSRNGAFATYVMLEAARLFKVPFTLSLRNATLAEPLACGIHATRLLGDVNGKNAVVIGPGIIGLSCFFAAKLAGAAKVLVAGIGDLRQHLVEQYGGLYVDSSQRNPGAAAREYFGGLADLVYECVGAQSVLDASIAMLKPGGSLMVMGVYEKPPVFPMNLFQEGERRLFTSQAHVDEISVALDYLDRGLIPAEPLITREVTLETLVEDGLEELAERAWQHIKVLIRMSGE